MLGFLVGLGSIKMSSTQSYLIKVGQLRKSKEIRIAMEGAWMMSQCKTKPGYDVTNTNDPVQFSNSLHPKLMLSFSVPGLSAQLSLRNLASTSRV